VATVVRLRPPAFSGGKRGPLPASGPAFTIRLQPMSREGAPQGASGAVLARLYKGYPVNPRLPDVTEQDRLQDNDDTDVRQNPVQYIVKGVRVYNGHHSELLLERVETA
jgi:hypothetical protein